MRNNLDQYAASYKSIFNYSYDNEVMLNICADRILNLCDAKEGKTLDLGLGHGITAEKFDHFFDDYTILEGSDLVIEQFNATHQEFKGKINKEYFEKFESESKFDTIIMSFILEHVENPVEILKKYRPLLSQNGSLYVSVPNFEALNKRIAFEAGLIQNMDVLSAADMELGHLRLYSVDKLSQELTEAGYEIDVIEGILLKPLTTSQLLSLNLKREVWDAMGRLGKNFPELSVGILVKARAL